MPASARAADVYEVGALNFGLGWYTEPSGDGTEPSGDGDVEPGVYTKGGPAWNNRNLKLPGAQIRSNCIFVHVRAAGPGMGV